MKRPLPHGQQVGGGAPASSAYELGVPPTDGISTVSAPAPVHTETIRWVIQIRFIVLNMKAYVIVLTRPISNQGYLAELCERD